MNNTFDISTAQILNKLFSKSEIIQKSILSQQQILNEEEKSIQYSGRLVLVDHGSSNL